METAGRQARAGGRSLPEEVTHLLAHGVLHLLGWDHPTAREATRMDAETRRIVRAAEAIRG